MLAYSDAVTITFSVISAVVLLALLVLLRILLRREPSPARWRRFRIGVFIERDAADDDVEEEEVNILD